MNGWDWKAAVEESRQKLVDKGMPLPRKPKVDLESMSFPTDITDVKDLALANMMIRFSAWYAYATSSLAFAKAEQAAITEVFDINLGERMFKLSKEVEGRPAKDLLKGKVLMTDEALIDMQSVKLRADQNVHNLSGLVAGLDIQVNALRSEQIRRVAAHKIEQHL
jgi:hypothetical protein